MLNPEVQVNFYERFNYLSFLIQKDEVIEWQVDHGHLGQEIVLFKERLIGLLQVMDLLRIAQILVYLYILEEQIQDIQVPEKLIHIV